MRELKSCTQALSKLLKELKLFPKYGNKIDFAIEINFDNTVIYENLTKVDGYISENKTTYILKIKI